MEGCSPGCGMWELRWCQRDTQEGRQNEARVAEGAHPGHTRWKRDKQVENSNFYLNKKTPKGRKEKPGAAPMGWKRHLPFAGCHGPAQLPLHTYSSQARAGRRAGVATRRGPSTARSSFPGRGNTGTGTKLLPQPHWQCSLHYHAGHGLFQQEWKLMSTWRKRP